MKKLKGFTLLELIIVMALLTIIVAGCMAIMEPIRRVYVDSTFYEAQRTTHNGMTKYITENVRYATNVGIYNSAANDLDTAVADFETKIGVIGLKTGTAEQQTKYKDYRQTLNVITIDNSTAYNYAGKDYYGRILRQKDINELSNGSTRLALGESYYGNYTYSIDLVDTSASKLNVMVSSILPDPLNSTTFDTDEIEAQYHVNSEAEANLKNIGIGGEYIKDTDFATSNQGTDTYIIFTLP